MLKYYCALLGLLFSCCEALAGNSLDMSAQLGSPDVLSRIPPITQTTTWNPGNTSGSMVLSNSNLTATHQGGAWASTISTGSGKSTGKWYWRTSFNLVGTNFTGAAATINTESVNNLLGNTNNSWMVFSTLGVGQALNLEHGGATVGTAGDGPVSNGDFVVIAWDATNGKLYFTSMTASGTLDTNWNGTSANPSTNTGGIAASGLSLQPGVSLLTQTGDAATLDTKSIISDPTLVGFRSFDR